MLTTGAYPAWQSGAPSPIRRGEISELHKSPGGTIHGHINPVDTEELFPLEGFRFQADRQVYLDAQPFLAESLPVTFESRPNGTADNVGVDFSRLQSGRLENFNGRSGWISNNGRDIYFEKSDLLNSRHLKGHGSKISYFAQPSFEAKALLVYPDNSEPSNLPSHGAARLPPLHSRSPSPSGDEDAASSGYRRPPSRTPVRRPSLPRSNLSHLDRELPGWTSRSAGALPALPPLPPIPTLSTGSTSQSAGLPALPPLPRLQTRGTAAPGLSSAPARLLNRDAQKLSTRSYADFGLRRSSSDPDDRFASSSPHGLRRSGSLAVFAKVPDSDPFAGSEGFDGMPKPYAPRASQRARRVSDRSAPIAPPRLSRLTTARPLVSGMGSRSPPTQQSEKDSLLYLFPA